MRQRSHDLKMCSVIQFLLQLGFHLLPVAVSTTCNTRLLADRFRVPDSAFKHSSAVNTQHGASASRDDPSDLGLQERAWCPDVVVHTELREFMQIDLGRQSVIKMIITKGRVAQSKGRQATPFFYIKYRRERTGLWFEYRKENGTQRLNGNQDAMTENYNTIEPPFVARFIRIYPFSLEPTKTCLKLEILGCDAHGVVEYQMPEGTIISDSIYGIENRVHQTRFQDLSYDSHSTTRERTDSTGELNHVYFPYSRMSTVTLRGGLGKLTDNDTETSLNRSPFASLKYVGWKQPLLFTRQRRQLELSDKRWTRSSSSHLEHIRIVFRFDEVYNFTNIKLFMANDFANGVLIPSNITVQVGMSDFGSDGGLRKTSWVSSVSLNPDRSNPSSRWIDLPTTRSCNGDVLSHTSTSRHQSVHYINSSNDLISTACSRFSIGQYVELKLYFAAEWIVLGEIAFENHRADSTIVNSEPDDVESSEMPRNILTTPRNIQMPPKHMFEAAFSHEYPTTMTLTVVCCLLVAMICVGLLGLLCAWRRKRLHRLIRQHRHKERLNGSAQFDGLNGQTGVIGKYSNQNGANSPAMLDLQAHFQHPHQCQELTITIPSSQPCLPGTQLYSNHLSSIFNIPPAPLPQSTLLASVDQTRTYPFQSTAPLVTLAAEQSNHPITNGLLQSSELVHFLPLTTSQISHPGHLPNLMPCNFGQPDLYRKTGQESAIYTSLPGSDCDSQPYARVVNGNALQGHGILVDEGNRLPTAAAYVEAPTTTLFTVTGQPVNVFHPTIIPPPPPSLPLPPIPPQHISPTQDRDSPLSVPDDVIDSGTPLLPNEQREKSSNWPLSSTIDKNRAWLKANLNATDQIMTSHLMNQFPTLSGSDYSNVTFGSSGNPYGAYYGPSTSLPNSCGLGNAAYPMQIRR